MQLDLCCISAKLTLSHQFFFAYFHSLMEYEIIFWANSSDSKKENSLNHDGCQILILIELYL
jgi:hypothetical protein